MNVSGERVNIAVVTAEYPLLLSGTRPVLTGLESKLER